MENILLASWYRENNRKQVTIEGYNNYLREKNKNKLAEFIYHRLHGRYLKPFEFSCSVYKKQYKNGFSIMANCCLLIETLQSFKKGLESTDRISGRIFTDFFSEEEEFKEFRGVSFYKNIRCGILHQGEVTGGFRISRKGKIFDGETRTINSYMFAESIEKVLERYKNELEVAEWDSELWDNFRRKMRAVIKNCEA